MAHGLECRIAMNGEYLGILKEKVTTSLNVLRRQLLRKGLRNNAQSKQSCRQQVRNNLYWWIGDRWRSEYKALLEWHWQGNSQSTERKPHPNANLRTTNPVLLAWVWTRASAATNRLSHGIWQWRSRSKYIERCHTNKFHMQQNPCGFTV